MKCAMFLECVGIEDRINDWLSEHENINIMFVNQTETKAMESRVIIFYEDEVKAEKYFANDDIDRELAELKKRKEIENETIF